MVGGNFLGESAKAPDAGLTSRVLVIGEVPDALARAVSLRRLGAIRTVRRGASPTAASQPAAELAGGCCTPATAVTLI